MGVVAKDIDDRCVHIPARCSGYVHCRVLLRLDGANRRILEHQTWPSEGVGAVRISL